MRVLRAGVSAALFAGVVSAAVFFHVTPTLAEARVDEVQPVVVSALVVQPVPVVWRRRWWSLGRCSQLLRARLCRRARRLQGGLRVSFLRKNGSGWIKRLRRRSAVWMTR